MKYGVPGFLKGKINQQDFEKWLSRKAICHHRRDRRRGNSVSSLSDYRQAIYQAIVECEGRDDYTGLELRWDLISTYDNDKALQGRRKYKADFADLPTVDHVGDGLGAPEFKICAWKVNESKAQLSLQDYLELCKNVLIHHGYKIN